MKKTEIKATCKEYNINFKTLKECLKKEKRKVLNTIFVHAHDLVFTRDAGDGTVEYLQPELTRKLINSLSDKNSKEINSNLTIFEKWQIVEENEISELFSPEYARKFYDVDFMDM